MGVVGLASCQAEGDWWPRSVPVMTFSSWALLVRCFVWDKALRKMGLIWVQRERLVWKLHSCIFGLLFFLGVNYLRPMNFGGTCLLLSLLVKSGVCYFFRDWLLLDRFPSLLLIYAMYSRSFLWEKHLFLWRMEMKNCVLHSMWIIILGKCKDGSNFSDFSDLFFLLFFFNATARNSRTICP